MNKPPALQLSCQELAEVWRVFKDTLGNAHLPPIYVFGSRANNTATSNSDLDLLIKEDEKLPLETYYALKDAFEYSHLPFRVDLLDWHRLSPDFQKVIKDELQSLPSEELERPPCRRA
jgi:predicted nucleotidyltransferase